MKKDEVYHLFSDGNYFPRAKKSGFGGYIQGPDEQILVEYTEQIKRPDYSYSFEILGILRGMQIAKSMEIEHLYSHCDEKNTVQKLNEMFQTGNTEGLPDNAKTELYEEVLNLAKEFKSFKVEYIPRAQNKHSDSLSRRYSLLMEKNFLRQYNQDLFKGHTKLKEKIKPKEKFFFYHEKMIYTHYKNNPFMVSQHRNKKMRRISKNEMANHQYSYLYVEMFAQDDKIFCKAFTYKDSNSEKILVHSDSFNNHQIDAFNYFLTDTLNQLPSQKLWIYSNIKTINSYLEQKDKIPNDQWDSFVKLHQSIEKHERVFFHWLPFEHVLSIELQNQDLKIIPHVETIEDLIKQMQKSISNKTTKKCFGMLVRHHLRNYKKVLNRDLEDGEKLEIITKTTEDLINRGLDVPNDVVLAKIRI